MTAEQKAYVNGYPEATELMARRFTQDGSGFDILPYDPDQYPFQDPYDAYWAGEPKPEIEEFRAWTDNLATVAAAAAGENYPDLYSSLLEKPNTSHIFGQAFNNLKIGRSVAFLPGHTNVKDIAFLGKLVADGMIDSHKYRPEMLIGVSKMVERLAFPIEDQKVPAIWVLSQLFDHVIKIIPVTDSAASATSKLPKSQKQLVNDTGKSKYFDIMDRDEVEAGIATFVAPTATTQEQKTIIITKGTFDMLRLPSGLITVTADVQLGEKPYAEFPYGIGTAKTEAGRDAIKWELGRVLSGQSRTEYSDPDNLNRLGVLNDPNNK
jgi:hypothetical protein